MSLIRNGGFERGNTDFWGVDVGGTLEISTANYKYGHYCGKYTAAGNALESLSLTDYIPVTPFSLINMVGWVKSDAFNTVYPFIFTYDGDYSLVSYPRGPGRYMDNTYLMIDAQFEIERNWGFIRVGYSIDSPYSGEIYYIDGVAVTEVTTTNALHGKVVLKDLTLVTTDGNTTNNPQDLKQYNTYYAQIGCDYISGSGATLDVDVCELDVFGNERVLASFASITTVSHETIALPDAIGNGMYIKYTVAGTTPNIDFGVDVIGKG